MESLSPLRHKTFAFLWISALVSNIGTWMHEIGAAWLMTELSDDPLMISLVASSTSLPVFLFVLLAGALADIFDRRKYLLCAQGFMLAFAAGLTLITWLGGMNPWLLLFFTFAIGTGAALMMPAWDAIIPEIVPKQDLPQAVSLGSIGVNAARAIGPAIAGFIISMIGSYAVFAINTLSFLGVITALALWKREAPERHVAKEHFFSAIRVGIRFMLFTRPLQLILIRAVLFFVPAIALLSLLPLYVRVTLQADALYLGYLQGSMGLGAIITAFAMPALKRHFSLDQLLLTSGLILASVFVLLGFSRSILVACIGLFIGGMAWITAFSLLRVKTQQAAPDWVRARALSLMLMASFGAMAAGSALWGQSVNWFDLQTTYQSVAVASALLAVVGLFFSFKGVASETFESSEKYDLHDEFHYIPREEEGPLLVAIEYAVRDGKEAEYLANILRLKPIRRRNGAFKWHLFRDLDQKGVYVEQFMLENWAEHVRQHDRTSEEEKAVHDAVFACCEEAKTPVVRHLLNYEPMGALPKA